MTVREEFIELVQEIIGPRDDFDIRQSFARQDIDSLDVMSIVLALEQKFAITIADEELVGIAHFDQLLRIVEIKLPD